MSESIDRINEKCNEAKRLLDKLNNSKKHTKHQWGENHSEYRITTGKISKSPFHK